MIQWEIDAHDLPTKILKVHHHFKRFAGSAFILQNKQKRREAIEECPTDDRPRNGFVGSRRSGARSALRREFARLDERSETAGGDVNIDEAIDDRRTEHRP